MSKQDWRKHPAARFKTYDEYSRHHVRKRAKERTPVKVNRNVAARIVADIKGGRGVLLFVSDDNTRIYAVNVSGTWIKVAYDKWGEKLRSVLTPLNNWDWKMVHRRQRRMRRVGRPFPE